MRYILSFIFTKCFILEAGSRSGANPGNAGREAGTHPGGTPVLCKFFTQTQSLLGNSLPFASSPTSMFVRKPKNPEETLKNMGEHEKLHRLQYHNFKLSL